MQCRIFFASILESIVILENLKQLLEVVFAKAVLMQD
jgi:hypothetical protein